MKINGVSEGKISLLVDEQELDLLQRCVTAGIVVVEAEDVDGMAELVDLLHDLTEAEKRLLGPEGIKKKYL